MNFPVVSLVVGPRPKKLLTLIFNLFMELNPPHTMLFEKDTKMGKDTFIS